MTSTARKIVNPRMTKVLGRQRLTQARGIEQVRAQALADFVGKRRYAVRGHDVLEAPVEEHAKVAVERGVGIGHRADQRVVDLHLDAVQAAQDQCVGVPHSHSADHGRLEVDASLDRAVLGHEQVPHQRRGVKATQLEREHGGAILLLPRGPWKYRRHQDVDQITVPLDHGGVADGAGELWRPANFLRDDPGQRRLGRPLGGNGPGPKGDQRLQAQLATEWEPVRIRFQRTLDVDKAGRLGIRR